MHILLQIILLFCALLQAWLFLNCFLVTTEAPKISDVITYPYVKNRQLIQTVHLDYFGPDEFWL